MLLGNPLTPVQHCPDRKTTNFARVIGPLGPLSVFVKDLLHFIAEAPLASLFGKWHESPRICDLKSNAYQDLDARLAIAGWLPNPKSSDGQVSS